MKSLLLVLTLVCTTAFAGSGNHYPTPKSYPSNTDVHATSSSNASAASASHSKSSSSSSAKQAQSQNQLQKQQITSNVGALSDSSSYNDGNSQAVTLNSEDRLQAPAVFAPAVYASGPCAYGWSAGASGPGAGLSFGRTKPDEPCNRRELARVLTPLNPALALKILCADPIAKEVATPEDCTYKPHDSASETQIDPAPTKQEVSDQITRAFKKSLSK